MAFIMGYVGVLREWVDLEPLFRAVKNLLNIKPDIHIKILIVGEEGGLNKNKHLTRIYGISERVVFTGTIPYSQVPEHISCMDICFVPFKKGAIAENSLPLKLLEYMACEKPVISTSLAGVKESVGSHVLYADNEDELSQRILDLYGNSDLRSRMGREGRKFVIENYTWHKNCIKLEELLFQVARSNKNK
jgi:glycosyltransferase involved in cell wall biosynthesis